MARLIGRLTALAVSRASKRGYYADGGGLYLQVGPTGAKSWVFRFRESGKLREAGLGATHTFSLAEAREKALQYRKARHDGIDPIEARKAERSKKLLDAAKAMTFRQCAEAYIAAHQAGWRNAKHGAQWGATLSTYVYPSFGELPVQAVDVGLVIKAVEPIWPTKPETASRVRGRIESILDWAATRGYRQGENPARWKGHLENLLAAPSKAKRAVRLANSKGEHHAALPYAEIAAFMVSLREQEGVAARALQFAILTAARTGEVIGAQWTEINVAERLWTIPAERIKAGREHRVPLSDVALAILEKMAASRSGVFVFPGGKADRPLSNMAFLMLLRRMGRGELTAHGFRSSFRDWVAEKTSFPAEAAELALAHAVGNKVEAAYRRGDQFERRRELAEAWARYCCEPEPMGRVVKLARPAAAAS